MKPISARRIVLTALLWLGMVALLFLALRQAPLVQIWAVLSQLRAGELLVLGSLNLIILVLLAMRWKLGLRVLGAPVPLRMLLGYRLAGFSVSYLTPGPQVGGEPLQVHLLHRKHGIGLTAAVSSVFLDRLVDQLANFTFLFVGVIIILVGGLAGLTVNAAILLFSASLLLLPLLHLAVLSRGGRPAEWLFGRLRTKRPAVQRLANTVREAEGQIAAFLCEQPLAFLQILGLSCLTWSFMIFEFWLSLRFLGVSASLAEAVSAQTAARLAFLMPFPAGLGALETSQVLATRLLGWEPAVGVALSLLIRARDLFLAVCGLLLGGIAYRSVDSERLVLEERSS